MKSGVAGSPVQAFELINQDRGVNFVERNRESERVRLSPAGEWTNNREATGAVIALVGDDQCWTSLGLLVSRFGVKVDPDEVSVARNVARHHSTLSFPRSAPAGISWSRFSGLICATSSFRV